MCVLPRANVSALPDSFKSSQGSRAKGMVGWSLTPLSSPLLPAGETLHWEKYDWVGGRDASTQSPQRARVPMTALLISMPIAPLPFPCRGSMGENRDKQGVSVSVHEERKSVCVCLYVCRSILMYRCGPTSMALHVETGSQLWVVATQTVHP